MPVPPLVRRPPVHPHRLLRAPSCRAPPPWLVCPRIQFPAEARRTFASSGRQHQHQQHQHQHQQKRRHNESFFQQLRRVLPSTKTVWYPIPVAVGIGVVAFTQLRHKQREQASHPDAPVKPMGSWQVQVLSTLPLKALSYYWGRFNEIPLPTFLRIPGFKLYSYIFGVNLAEVERDDLRSYKNLAEFFYRNLKPDVRPIDPRPNALVSPADGVVLQFGEVHAGGHVEQVKGMTYSLDALLGAQAAAASLPPQPDAAAAVKAKLEGKGIDPGTTPARWGKGGDGDKAHAHYTADEEFAKINGISYNLPSLLSGASADEHASPAPADAADPASATATAEVAGELSRGAVSSWWGGDVAARRKRLFFAVVYLAPGDYHHFHSPVSWVVERRRHFAGELYSVAPVIQRRLPGLFTLNERVVLLGRWRWGMFSMTPVGATNVGSIRVSFDTELRTNTLTRDPTGLEGKEGAGRGFVEATYAGASALLGGHPLAKGAEMGGFMLGSTVVLVFEAPGSTGEDGSGGFRFVVERGQKVKVGEALGLVEE